MPGGYPTIQAAIDAAAPGDKVVIADGVYSGPGNVNLSLIGKDITVRSASGDPNTCIIDCEGSGWGFGFGEGVTAATVLHALTIRNGGQGVLCYDAGPTLSGCIITDNAGYGIEVGDSGMTLALTDCTIRDNGIGMICQFSNALITHCDVSDNDGNGLLFMQSTATVSRSTIALNGGGIYASGYGVTITDCIISDNALAGVEGASSVTGCTISGNLGSGISSPGAVSNCTITGNGDGTGRGGGVACGYGATLTNCIISGNSAYRGGGVYFEYLSWGGMSECVIADNSATFGGGIWCRGGAQLPYVVNCTIRENAALQGGGIYGSGARVANCVIAGNVGSGAALYGAHSGLDLSNCTVTQNAAGPGSGGMYFWSSDGGTLRNCIVWNNTPSDWAGAGVPTWNCIMYTDPLFRDPDGADDDPNTCEDNDYRLLPGSPAIDLGDNASVLPDELDLDSDGNTVERLPFDLGGRTRFVDDPATPDCPWDPGACGTPPIVDIGAYEHQRDGDCDGSGAIDAGDAAQQAVCLTGPDVEPAIGCACGDFDLDHDVDIADVAGMQAAPRERPAVCPR